jgi:para-aminobenzoate synthetase component II
MDTIALVDNHGSFTYSLLHLLAALDVEVVVLDRDEASPADLEALSLIGIVLSPGPGHPAQADLSTESIRRFAGRVPLLGVGLGHQCVAHEFGGRIEATSEIVHGLPSLIYHNGEGVLRDLPSPFEAARYHSLAVNRAALPEALRVTAQTASGIIMGLRHHELPIEGIQFNLESLLCPAGAQIAANFVGDCKARAV